MIALVTLFVVIVVSLLVTRIATIALTLTGMSRESARFQARSAFSGVGFTTSEAEAVVSHPVRRRIVLLLMLVGSAGIVTGIATLMLTFLGAGGFAETGSRVLVLAVGLSALWLLANSSSVDRQLRRVIGWALRRWTKLDVRDYAGLLHLSGDFAVMEMTVQPDDWVTGKTLAELDLREEGMLVLGIERAEGGYRGAPTLRTRVRPGDTLIVYGRSSRLEELDRRPAGAAGDEAHAAAVAEQRRLLGEEVEADEEADEEEPAAERA